MTSAVKAINPVICCQGPYLEESGNTNSNQVGLLRFVIEAEASQER